MASKFSEKEIKAIERKAERPNEPVICPRCGKELTYREVGNSWEVKCPTKDCIIASCRGL